MDQKHISNLRQLPYLNQNFSKFFEKKCGLASTLTEILNSVNAHNFDNLNANTFNVYVGEETVQALSVDGCIDFLAKFDINGDGQYCFGTMADSYSKSKQVANFSVQQGANGSAVVCYSHVTHDDKNQTVTSSGTEVITEDSHIFLQNSFTLDQNNQIISAQTEQGSFYGDRKFSTVHEVTGQDLSKIDAEKNELIEFADQVSSLVEGYKVIDNVRVVKSTDCSFEAQKDVTGCIVEQLAFVNLEQ